MAITNIEKENQKLKKDLEKQIDENEKHVQKIQELEGLIENMKEPIEISKVFDLLPIHDATEALAKLQSNLYGKIRTRQDDLSNELGLLENNLELMKIYSKHIVDDKLFTHRQ